MFTIAGKTLTPAGKINLGDAKSGPSSVAFTPDGKMALVTRDGDNKISVLTVNGNTVELSKREIYAGLKPYPLGISPSGDFAAIASVGMGNGDADTISLIDLKANPPRVVDTVSVGQTPESLTVAPDGKHVVVTVMNGSNKPPGSPFLNAQRAGAGLRGGEHAVPQGGGDQGRPLVPGCGVEQGHHAAAGPVHGRAGNPAVQVRRQVADTGRRDQGQRRPCRDCDDTNAVVLADHMTHTRGNRTSE